MQIHLLKVCLLAIKIIIKNKRAIRILKSKKIIYKLNALKFGEII